MTKTPTEEAVERLKETAYRDEARAVMARSDDVRLILSELSRLQAERDRAVDALTEARDLLLERIHGSPARSAAHNARVRIESALQAVKEAGAKTTEYEDAMRESAYLAGMKAGWNFGVVEDKDGYLKAVEAREGYLKPILAARAAKLEAALNKEKG